MVSVYVTVKSKKLNEDFCSSIDKSNIAKVSDFFFTLKDCRKILSVRTPNILLLGLDLTDGYWIDFCSEIRKKYPALQILAITTYDEYVVFKNTLNNLALLSGYISKDALPKVIVSAIQAVKDGNFFRYDKIVVPVEIEENDPERLLAMIREMVKNIKNDGNHQEMIEKMSMMIDAAEKYRKIRIKKLLSEEKDDHDANIVDRYLKILIENLLIKGYPNWDIADMLNVSIETVRLYRMEFILKLSGQNSMILADKSSNEPIKLGRREMQLLRLIAAGYTNQEVADNVLYVDIETIKTFRKNLILKFETKNSMTMVIKALRLGLLKLEDIDALLS
jgi:DNA-binding NarL/FixJ family response regulator